jgi:hypothetical protein
LTGQGWTGPWSLEGWLQGTGPLRPIPWRGWQHGQGRLGAGKPAAVLTVAANSAGAAPGGATGRSSSGGGGGCATRATRAYTAPPDHLPTVACIGCLSHDSQIGYCIRLPDTSATAAWRSSCPSGSAAVLRALPIARHAPSYSTRLQHGSSAYRALAGLELARAYLPATCRMGEPTTRVLPSSRCVPCPGCPFTWHPQAHTPVAACCNASSSRASPSSIHLAHQTRCPAEPGSPPTPSPLPARQLAARWPFQQCPRCSG